MKTDSKIESMAFQLAIDEAPASIVISDSGGIIVYINKKFTELTGYTSEDVVGKNPQLEKSGVHSHEFYQSLLGNITAEETWSGEILNQRKDGAQYWERAKISPVLNSEGEITHYVTVKQDVTDEKEREFAANRRERILNDIERVSNTGGWEYDVHSKEMFWTDELYRIHGFEKPFTEKLVDESLQCFHPEDRPLVEKSFNDCINEGKEYDLIVRFFDKSGNFKWLKTKSQAMLDESGKVEKLIGSVRDVTDQIEAEEKLKFSEKRYRELFSRSADANLIFKHGKLLDCNRAALNLLGYENKNDIIGKSVADFSPEFQPDGSRSDERMLANIKSLTNSNSSKFEWNHKRKDGSILPVEVMVTNISDHNGGINYVVWRDITKRKDAEKKIMDSLSEKVTLLSEIHHRVKNNLAVISSLMQLQLYNVNDEQSVEILNSSINRIKSIALIHEQLYSSENFTKISLNQNITKQAQSILEIYKDKSTLPVEIDYDLEEVTMNIKQALPVGLLVNEVLINSFRHAFHGKDRGVIKISLQKNGDTVVLKISDNGIGFDSSAPSEGSLGRTLINTFASQLEAEIKIDSENGTQYEISFSQQDEKKAGAFKSEEHLP